MEVEAKQAKPSSEMAGVPQQTRLDQRFEIWKKLVETLVCSSFNVRNKQEKIRMDTNKMKNSGFFSDAFFHGLKVTCLELVQQFFKINFYDVQTSSALSWPFVILETSWWFSCGLSMVAGLLLDATGFTMFHHWPFSSCGCRRDETSRWFEAKNNQAVVQILLMEMDKIIKTYPMNPMIFWRHDPPSTSNSDVLTHNHGENSPGPCMFWFSATP